MNFNCLLLSSNKQTVDDMFKICNKHEMSFMRTDEIVEFLQNYASMGPELAIIDYDTLENIELIDKMLEMSVKSMKGVLILTGVEKDFINFRNITRLEQLENEIILRKVALLNSKCLTLSNESSMQLKSIISDYLVDYGYLPKYQGFIYFKEIIYINITNQIIDKNLSKSIFPLVAKKFFTTIYGVEQALRTIIAARNTSAKKSYPYSDKPSIKEVINYITEMINNDLPPELKING